MLNKELLEIIVCPKCGGDLVLENGKNDKLICHNDNQYYPILEGIPMLLVEEAKEINE